MEIIGIKSVIVYNHLNYEAVLAAAIIKQENPTMTAVTITHVIPTDYDTYIWVGIDPDKNTYKVFHDVRDKNHVVLLGDIDHVERRNPKIPLDSDATPGDDIKMRATLIEQVCKDITLVPADAQQTSEYQKLAFHASRFHSRTTELESLALVYAALLYAQNTLWDDEPFIVPSVNEQHIKDYQVDSTRAKRGFINNYKSVRVVHEGLSKTLFYTATDGFGYHLMLRMIKLTHKNYMNVIYGMEGPIIYTNLLGLNLENTSNPLVLN